MSRPPLVQKASGEMQPFSTQKLRNSLQRARANTKITNAIVEEIEPYLYEGIKTQEIYKRAFGLLRRHERSLAARYGLKKAIMDLGPSGYPFEHFIGNIFRHKGYDVKVGQVLQGHCVTHEVDVVAVNHGTCHLVECKFANSAGKYSNVKIPLYVRARMDDVIRNLSEQPDLQGKTFQAWVVTNTRFTTDAMDYGVCSGLNMLSWDLPEGNSLKGMVERLGLFPVTTLTSLYKREKDELLNRKVVLCRELLGEPQLLDNLGIKSARRRKVIGELEDLCGE